eukprot:12102057-Ditylum_brightwellii.AAC.1
MKVNTASYSFNGDTNRSSRSIGRNEQSQHQRQRRNHASVPVPPGSCGILLIASMSSTLPMVTDECDSDNGSEADELDNEFNGKTNTVSDKEYYQAGDEAVVPDIPDHYNGPEELKDGVEHKFNTVLEFIFKTSGMDMDCFQEQQQIQKYAQEHMGLYKKFAGQKWRIITVEEM